MGFVGPEVVVALSMPPVVDPGAAGDTLMDVKGPKDVTLLIT